MKITIQRQKCEGYGKCVEVAPKVFQLDEKMISKVVDPKGDAEEKIVLAARVCPTKAIIIEDESGKRVFPQEP